MASDRIVSIKLQADATGVTRGFKEAGAAATGLKAKVAESARSQREEWAAVGAGLTAVGVTITGIGIAALKTGIQYNTLQQTTRAALTTLLGSAEAANAQMDKLDAFARESPFAKQTFITAQQQMLAFGVETQKVIAYLDAVQNGVAAMGGSNQQISEIAFIMSQISAAGKITGQDLMQFGQRGVNAAELIGSQMGKTGQEIRAEITAGTLDANQALDALAAGMQERYAGAAANVKNTFEGSMDRVKAAWRDFSAELAKPLVDPNGGGALIELLNWTADAMRNFQKLPEPIKAVTSGLVGLSGAAALLLGAGMFLLPRWLDFTDSLRKVAANATSARVSMARMASFAVGPWGAAIAAAVTLIGIFVAEKQKLADQADRLADTLDTESGAVTANSTAWAANELQKEGVLSSAKRLGISAKDLTEAWLGNADALERVNARMELWKTNSDFRMENANWDGWSEDLVAVDYALEGSNQVLADAKTRHEELAEATQGSGDAAAGSVGPTNAAATATDELGTEADEAAKRLDVMKGILDEVAGSALGMGEAKDRARSAINSLEEAAKNEEASLSGTNDASIKLRDSMREVERTHRDSATAILENGGSMKDAMREWRDGRNSVIRMRMAMGESRTEAQAWADKNLGSAAEVKGALREVKKAATDLDGKRAQIKIAADSRAALAAIKAVNDALAAMPEYKHISVSGTGGVYGLTAQPKSGKKAYGGTVGLAHGGTVPGFGGGVAGGTVWGTGTGKSDSVLVNLSRGEEVVQEPWASVYRNELKAMNNGSFRWPGLAPSSASVGAQTVVVQRVEVPTEITIVDSGGALVGRMKVEAGKVLSDATRSLSSQALFDQLGR